MNEQEVLDSIKANAFIEVIIRPSEFSEKRISDLRELHEIIYKSKVSMRGWDFPSIDDKNNRYGDDYYLSFTEWWRIKEYWRYFQSGQFIHFSSFWENLDPEITADIERRTWFEDKAPEHKGYIDILSLLFRLTEILEFTSRIINYEYYKNQSIEISVNLNNVDNCQLVIYDKNRYFMHRYYSKQSIINNKLVKSINDIIVNKNDIAFSLFINTLTRFNWKNIPDKIFKEDQMKFVSKR